MADLIVAIGLVLVIEGLLYGGFPSFARRLAMEASATPESVLRAAGIAAIVAGVFIVWLVRG